MRDLQSIRAGSHPIAVDGDGIRQNRGWKPRVKIGSSERLFRRRIGFKNCWSYGNLVSSNRASLAQRPSPLGQSQHIIAMIVEKSSLPFRKCPDVNRATCRDAHTLKRS
jgi:hypothetical protein